MIEFVFWICTGFLSYCFYIIYVAKLELPEQKRRATKSRATMAAKVSKLTFHLRQFQLSKPKLAGTIAIDIIDILLYYLFFFKWLNPVGKMDTTFFIIAGSYVVGVDWKYIILRILDIVEKIIQQA